MAGLVVLGPLGACGRSEPAAEAEKPVGVSVQPVRRQSIRDAATASGLVVPAAAGEWTIYAPSSAQIARLPLKEQDPIAVGDVLVQFEIASVTHELNLRQAAVTEATARSDRAKAEFARMSGLFERGIASRNAFESARAEQTTSASVLTQAIAELEATKIENSQATIRARFAGIVARVYHAEGDFVGNSPTDPILQVVDPTRMQVAAQFPIPTAQAQSTTPSPVEAAVAVNIVRRRIVNEPSTGGGGGGGGGTVDLTEVNNRLTALEEYDIAVEARIVALEAANAALSGRIAVLEDILLTVTTDRLIGRWSPGEGPAQEIKIGTGLDLVGDTLVNTGGGVSVSAFTTGFSSGFE